MKRPLSYILNLVFVGIFIVGFAWFIYSIHTTMTPKIYYTDLNHDSIQDTVYTNETRVRDQESHTNVNWESLLTMLGGVLSFSIKLYYERKDKKIEADTPIAYDNVHHPIFAIITELQLTKLKNLDLGSPGKTAVFKAMLTAQVNAYKHGIEAYINETFLNDNDFRNKSRLMLLRIVDCYEQEWRTLGVPEIVISRYKEIQQEHIEVLMQDIESLTFSRLNENDNSYDEVIYYIITHISVILRLSLSSDAFRAIKDLNGTLKTVKYNGLNL